MRVQDDSRSKGDRSMVVRCSCGAEVVRLRPGQVLNLRKPGRSLEVTCKSCGHQFAVNVTELDDRGGVAA